MSENIENYNFDEIEWEDCFTPSFSSTQKFHSGKRQAEEVEEKTSKKNIINSDTTIKPSVKEFCERSLLKARVEQSVNKVAKRIFPGPAGLLPDRLENKSISELVSEELADETDNDTVLCSQQTVLEFEDGPWKKMMKDFSVSDGEQLYEKFTISWIKKNSALQKVVVSYKAPFLASVIHSIEVMEGKIPTINVTLKDSTGVIGGTISHSLYEEYAAYLTVGSVSVLKQFGILSIGDSYCVTITPTNLLTIYHKAVPKKTLSDNNRTFLEKVVVNQMRPREIWNTYYQDIEENLKQQSSQKLKRINKNNEEAVRTGVVGLNSNPFFSRTSSFESSNLRPMQTVENVHRHLIQPNPEETRFDKISFTPVNKKKFDFKKINGEKTLNMANNSVENAEAAVKKDNDNVMISCSQVLVQTDKKHTEIWKNLFEEVDADSLFDEF